MVSRLTLLYELTSGLVVQLSLIRRQYLPYLQLMIPGLCSWNARPMTELARVRSRMIGAKRM